MLEANGARRLANIAGTDDGAARSPRGVVGAASPGAMLAAKRGRARA